MLKGLLRRAPSEDPSRHARSSSVHFRNSPFGLRQSKLFNPRTWSPAWIFARDCRVARTWQSVASLAFILLSPPRYSMLFPAARTQRQGRSPACRLAGDRISLRMNLPCCSSPDHHALTFHGFPPNMCASMPPENFEAHRDHLNRWTAVRSHSSV